MANYIPSHIQPIIDFSSERNDRKLIFTGIWQLEVQIKNIIIQFCEIWQYYIL
jgi:hypothetical protein